MTPDELNADLSEPVEPAAPESVNPDEAETVVEPSDLDASAISAALTDTPVEPPAALLDGALSDDTEILERRAPPPDAAPPRIVAETPLGGQPRPLHPTLPQPRPTPLPPNPPVISPHAPAEAGSLPALDDTQKLADTLPDGALSVEKLRQQIRERTASAPPAAESSPPAEKTAADPPAAPVAPAQVRSSGPDQPARPAEKPAAAPAPWDKDEDDDLSPELAAVLFGQRDKPAADQPAAARPAAPTERTPAARPAQPVPAPEAPGGPVTLTAVEDARRLPLRAADHHAAAPDTALSGKVRYMRIEEPLKRDSGQRIQESWQYFKPDYPAVGGRLVREVRSEEHRHADGSWFWRYERTYTDGGRDRREVRANTDHSYIERSDEVSVRDDAGKRQTYREQAALILAEAEREEKRGFLSGLFGRDDDDQDAGGAKKSWRPATNPESRRARKQGGAAF